ARRLVPLLSCVSGPAPPELYTLSLHDALPILAKRLSPEKLAALPLLHCRQAGNAHVQKHTPLPRLLRLALAASLTFLSSLSGCPDSRMARIVAARSTGVI